MDTSELLKQRRRTRAIAELFSNELRSYLQAAAPLINPRTVFGEHIHGAPRGASTQGAKALQALQSAYDGLRNSRPFNLRNRFDTPIALLGTAPEVHPVSYHYTARAADSEKQVLVTSPLKWVLSYEGFGLDRLRGALSGSSGREAPSVQDAVLHSLMLAITLDMKPGVRTLFEALRFPISVEQREEFGALPIVVISGPLATRLPDDPVIIDSTEISGTTDFEEIVDEELLDNFPDPLREKLLAL